MATPLLTSAVYKLAIAGEQSGLSLEDMIEMLNAGVTVELLLNLIERRLRAGALEIPRSSAWLI